MKLFSFCFLMVFVFILSSCGGNEKENTTNEKDTSAVVVKKRYDTEKLTGVYQGPFGKSTVILQINYAQGKNASGYNILRGVKRNIKGSLEQNGGSFHFKLSEPGNEKYDGVFEFDIDTTSFVLSGKWTPNDPSATDEKTFTLDRIELTEKISNDLESQYSGRIGDLEGTLILNKNGTLVFDCGYYDERKKDTESGGWIKLKIKGTYFQAENSISIEFENHPKNKFPKITLKMKKMDEMDDAFLYSGQEGEYHAELYPYMYY